jgi:polar amino acid transport system substrate-binding protein
MGVAAARDAFLGRNPLLVVPSFFLCGSASHGRCSFRRPRPIRAGSVRAGAEWRFAAPFFCAALLSLAAPFASPGAAQSPEPGVFVPRFVDPARRIERPDLSGRVLRVLTDDDYPPFHFLTPDGRLVGFNVDLARAICVELEVACTIQPRRFDTLLDALAQSEGDLAVASLAPTPAARRKAAFSLPYYRTPGRFVTRRGSRLAAATPEALAGQAIGVEAGTTHEAYLKTFFPEARLKSYGTNEATRAALRAGEVEALFGDGVTLALWLNGADSNDCCLFFGGPFTDSRWFGEGAAIALRPADPALKRGIDWALGRLEARGATAELYLKYFPVGFY